MNIINTMYKIIFTTLICFSSWCLSASIYCPPNKTLNCNDDIYYLPLTGTPTTFGYPPSMVKYTDNRFLDQCNTGYVDRIWYIDINQDNQYQSTEASCTQRLTLIMVGGIDVEVTFPANVVYTCQEDITDDTPQFLHGPCDVMGYTVEDEVFTVAADACYKIFRKFRVINWCTYRPSDPNWDGSGIWTHTQVIKVVEKTPPTIADCTNKIVGVESDCKALITLTNSAIDDANCPSQILSWVVEIDLWGDGTTDYTYGYNEKDLFYLAPASNGGSISITLPERVGIGKHKVYWSVKDQCGNFKTCNTIVETKDLKRPTPYMHVFLTTAFQANIMDLTIPARWFNVGSLDNCTAAADLRYSFSPNVNDSVRVIDCTNAGFQFFRIYVTDLAGNYDGTDAFMLVLDNESCNLTHNLTGNIMESNGRPMPQVSMSLQRDNNVQSVVSSDNNGVFGWEAVSLFDDYSIHPDYHTQEIGRVNIADLKKLQNVIMGLDSLVNFEYVAADLTGDGKVKINDLVALKNRIFYPSLYAVDSWRFLVDVDSIASMQDLKNYKEVLDIMNFDGSIDFIAVYKGDITGANNITTQPRNTIQYTWNQSNGQLDLVFDTEGSLEGMELSIVLPTDIQANDVVVQSSLLDVSSSNLQIDGKTNTIKIVQLKDMNIKPSDVVLSLSMANDMPIGQVMLSDQSLILLPKYQTLQLKRSDEKEEDTNVVLYPNPASTDFSIYPVPAKVLSIQTIQGQSIPFANDGGRIHLSKNHNSGIILVTTEYQGKVYTKKLFVQ